jgi:hypothetical protein
MTLSNALKTGHLDDFIEQEDARGIGPVGRAELERTTAALVKPPPAVAD